MIYLQSHYSVFKEGNVNLITMNDCISCKNNTSDDRCPVKAIKGLVFCGRHAKSNSRRIWHDVHQVDTKVVKIQSVWRGFHLRNKLNKLGKGVLKRSLCHNEEELITMDPVSKIHPFSFFSFEEDGKVWAFEFNSLSKIFVSSPVPLNPYTRTPLTHETRRRLRWYCRYLTKNDKDMYDLKLTKYEIQPSRINQICQILDENGFDDFRPEYLEVLTNEDASIMRTLILYMMIDESKQRPPTSRWHKYVSLFKSKNYMSGYRPLTRLSSLITTILADTYNTSDEYMLCFIIIAAYSQI